MPAGKLREVLAFDKKADLSQDSPPGDGAGNMEGGFEEQFRLRARIRPLSQREQILADLDQGTEQVVATMRYSAELATVTTAWRARGLWNGKEYNIRSVTNPDEKKRFIDMLLESGVAI